MENLVIALLDNAAGTLRGHASAVDAIAPRHAPHANIFDHILGYENSVSSVLAWLLDPKGTHGQKETFLRLFTRHFCDGEWAVEEAAAAIVSREMPTGQGDGRIDLLVETKRAGRPYALIVENKPWAKFQPQQLTRYIEEGGRRSPNAFEVIVLGGWEESAVALVEEHFSPKPIPSRCVSRGYDLLAAWARDCRLICQAPRIADLLWQLEDWIRREFGGYMHSDELAVILKTARSSEERLKTAIQIVASGAELKRAVLRDFIDDVAPGWTDEAGAFMHGIAHNPIVLDIGHPGIRFVMQSDSKDFGELGYGLYCYGEDAPVSLRKDAEEALGCPTGYEAEPEKWPYWRYFSGDTKLHWPDHAADPGAYWAQFEKAEAREKMRLFIAEARELLKLHP